MFRLFCLTNWQAALWLMLVTWEYGAKTNDSEANILRIST